MHAGPCAARDNDAHLLATRFARARRVAAFATHDPRVAAPRPQHCHATACRVRSHPAMQDSSCLAAVQLPARGHHAAIPRRSPPPPYIARAGKRALLELGRWGGGAEAEAPGPPALLPSGSTRRARALCPPFFSSILFTRTHRATHSIRAVGAAREELPGPTGPPTKWQHWARTCALPALFQQHPLHAHAPRDTPHAAASPRAYPPMSPHLSERWAAQSAGRTAP